MLKIPEPSIDQPDRRAGCSKVADERAVCDAQRRQQELADHVPMPTRRANERENRVLRRIEMEQRPHGGPIPLLEPFAALEPHLADTAEDDEASQQHRQGRAADHQDDDDDLAEDLGQRVHGHRKSRATRTSSSCGLKGFVT
jgi:hypothetical protein